MTIKFNLTATIEIPNVVEFPPKEAVEEAIIGMLEFEGMIPCELVVTNYTAEEDRR